jgi:hypothetical protein
MEQRIVEPPSEQEERAEQEDRAPGVVIGVLMGFEGGRPLVIYPGNPAEQAVPARSAAALRRDDVGAELALLFEDGDPARPLVVGRILPAAGTASGRLGELQVRLADERLELSARREVVIRCGKASITLTPSGKVLIRGTYVSSRSSGANRIKGGSVQLN